MCRLGRIAALVGLFLLWSLVVVPGDSPSRVRHPNLLLNRQELEEIRQKIEQQGWAAALFARVKALADEPGVHPERNLRETALVYAITLQKSYGEKVRQHLVHLARASLPEYEKVNLPLQPEFGAWGPWGVYAWAYDLCYDCFAPQERELVERWLRTVACTIIAGEKLWTTTPNLVFDKHCRVGLIGYCLGDKELIDWALHDRGAHGPRRGGFYAVLDSMIQDGHFWGEAPIYALHYDVHGMLALAEAARHYDGTNLYDYVAPKSKASIRSILDGYLRMAFPLERTGIGQGSIRLATFGDGATSYGPLGTLHDTFLANPIGRPAPGEILGELEIAYRYYRDPGYAWLLCLNPARDHAVVYGRAVWGYTALTHGLALPDNPPAPPAPSGVYPSQGFAMLRADESPRYWTSGALAAVIRLGRAIGHGHEDYYSLILHGKGRLLYPDLNVIQYEPTYLNWTHEGIAHNTLLVDYQSPRPGPFTTQHEFTPEVKYFAIRGQAFADVEQSRTLLLAPEYLVDVFQAADQRGRVRTYDWVLHGLGRLYPGNPQAYQPGNDLLPFYWWIDNERRRTTDATWQADWLQQSAGVTPGAQPLGKEWFTQRVGVRLTMLGEPQTQVYCGDGPITDGPPYHRIEGHPEGSSPLVIARRRAVATSFVAVHEPYDSAPQLVQVERLLDKPTTDVIALRLQAPRFTDYVLLGQSADQELCVENTAGVAFRFRRYAWLRLRGDGLVIRGQVSGFRLPWQKSEPPKVILNGQEIQAHLSGGWLSYGSLAPLPHPPAVAPPAPPSSEQRAWIHAWFLPEEVHLPVQGEGEATLHLTCIGQGSAQGTYEVVAPAGLVVSPSRVDVPALQHGQSHQVRLRIRATADAPARLDTVHLRPVQDAALAAADLAVSVGVVMTEDRRLPRLAQFVVRAPGYTMRVDHFSGVSYYLLDADGHRRHGRMNNTNFIQGFPGVQRGNTWCFRYRQPCRFVWRGPNTLTVGCDGLYNDGDARLQYTFHPDHIEIALVPPTRPDVEHTVWLGNFNALQAPQHNGQQKAPHEPIVADRFFFRHPVYRQGVLLILPQKLPLRYLGSAVHFPLRAGQKVILRFATAEQAQPELSPSSGKSESAASAANPAAQSAALEVQVGPLAESFRGQDGATVQKAIDYVAERGGGVVCLAPTRFVLRSPLQLRDHVQLLGVPHQTVLVPHDWCVVALAEDARAGSREIRLAETRDLRVGDGIALRDDQASGFAITVTTLAEQIGPNRFRLAQPVVRGYSVKQRARAARLFPLILGERVRHVRIQDITIEGRRPHAPFYQFADGCRTAGIYLYQCEDVVVRGCVVRDYPGDGISFQWQSRRVTIEDCLVANNNVFGIHPGSDSHDCLVRNNRIQGNGGPGLFVCVGVKRTRFEKNLIQNNRGPGISIGCCDTDNVFTANTITGNGRGAILFRDDRNEQGQPAGAHRNRFEKNIILDNTPFSADGAMGHIAITGVHEELVFRENIIGRSQPEGAEVAGILILGQAPGLVVEGNEFRHVQPQKASK
ncbi:hypothetical protein HRbin36_00231 [bacterium HR36]|nr:hypothetical protein HRbin36_00231 [bacterium HR36]